MIRRVLLAWAAWIYHHYAVPIVVVTAELRQMIAAAETVVGELDAIPDPTSSEWKHATAFGRLVKRYPSASRRTIGLAIELALRGL